MTSGSKQYNYCLDFIKGIACICVVLMHCEFPGTLGMLIQTMSRFCVPFFFMVSGYYWYRERNPYDPQRIRRKVKHVLGIAVFATVLYVAFALLQNIIWHDVPVKVTKSSIAMFLLFNEPSIVAGQMWFLYALLYVYLLAWLMDKFRLQKFAYVWGAIMMVLLFVLGQGVHLIGGGIPVPHFILNDFGGNVPHLKDGMIPVPNFIYRNFLIEGTAFFMLGHWVHSHQDKLKFSNGTLLSVVLVFTVLCIGERLLMHRDFGVNICTLPQVLALFLYGIYNPSRHEGTVQRLGRDCSMLVYVLHPFVWHSLERVYTAIGVSDSIPAAYMLPVLVVLLTIALALFCNYVMKILSERKQIAA